MSQRITIATNAGAGTTSAQSITQTGRWKLFIQGTFGGSGLVQMQSKYGNQTAFQNISTDGGIALDAAGNNNTLYLVQGEEIRAVITDVTGCYIELGYIGD